tara:strand:- start:162 stop:932 length:771 start_codon:yes stop_codon:yes gene_type:complete
MAKYQRAEVKDDLNYSEEMQQQEQVAVVEPTGEESTYKKRYGDLRRHSQQLMQQKDQEVTRLQDQLSSAAKGQIKFPKTDAEIDQWTKKYPDVANIVDTIARKRANEALAEGEKKMENLKKLESKLTRQEAEQALIKLHPDFDSIRRDPAFHDWVAMQPMYIQDALYKNNADATAAARAVDLYKADTKKATSNNRGAATSVGRTSSGGITPSTGKGNYSESMVEKMSDAEYDKHEAAILESMRGNKFVYDISGAAR